MCPNSPSFGFDSRPRRCNLNADKHFHIAGKVSIMGLLNHDRIPIMTVSYAHIIMQLHIDCALCVCPVKQQAKQRLVEAKHLVPDSGRR